MAKQKAMDGASTKSSTKTTTSLKSLAAKATSSFGKLKQKAVKAISPKKKQKKVDYILEMQTGTSSGDQNSTVIEISDEDDNDGMGENSEENSEDEPSQQLFVRSIQD